MRRHAEEERDGRWRLRAACRGLPGPEASRLFFPMIGDRETIEEALAYCRACPVRRECKRYQEEHEPFADGIWGGTTEDDRASSRAYQARAARRRRAPPAPEGLG